MNQHEKQRLGNSRGPEPFFTPVQENQGGSALFRFYGTFHSLDAKAVTILTQDESWHCLMIQYKKTWLQRIDAPQVRVKWFAGWPKVVPMAFWFPKWFALIEALPRRQAVNYIFHILFQQLCIWAFQFNKGSSTLIHTENAGPRRSEMGEDYLKEFNFPPVPHSLCSPDLNPSDFCLFDVIK
jgi:hypothetical protein